MLVLDDLPARVETTNGRYSRTRGARRSLLWLGLADNAQIITSWHLLQDVLVQLSIALFLLLLLLFLLLSLGLYSLA